MTLRHRAVTAAVRVPGVVVMANRLARRLAGRHFVAAVAVVVRDEEVLLVSHTFRGGAWALPGGWVRRREDPAAACAREVGEETGIDVEVVDVVGCDLHAIDGVPLAYGGITLAFACRPRLPVTDVPLPRSVELQAVSWSPVGAAVDALTGFERVAVERSVQRLRDVTS